MTLPHRRFLLKVRVSTSLLPLEVIERLEELLARLPAGGMDAPAFDLSSDEDDPDDDVQVINSKV